MTGTFIDAFEDPQPGGVRLSVWDRGDFADLSWDDWRGRAAAASAALRDLGVGAGARVGCILTNAPSTCAAAVGIWLAGGCVVSLPTIGRGMDTLDYIRSLRRMCAESGTQLVLAEGRYAEQLAQAELEVPVAAYEALAGGGRGEPAPPGAEDAGFIQYSSGSTSTPKGCVLTMRAIGAQIDMLAGRLELQGAEERGVSWLPLSHDMGFFGCLMLSFAKGMRLTLSTPTRFLRSPRTWIEDCVRTGATITATPNSGLKLALDALPRGAGGRFPMRKLVIGGERVEESVLRSAVDVLGPAGLRRRDLLPAYGLAEAVLAVTMPLVEEEPRVMHLRTDALLRGELDVASSGDRDGTTPCVSLGPPLERVSVSIDGDGIGEIVVASPSLADGYAGNPELTAERFTSGMLRTGDLGFVDGGELFAVGRTDDMLCLGGRNVFATDVEADLGALRGVRPGTPVLVEVPDGEDHRVVILAEPESASGDLEEIAEAMAVTAARVSGIRPDECWLLPPGAVPKTPSGKVQRFRARQLLAEGGREAVARVSF